MARVRVKRIIKKRRKTNQRRRLLVLLAVLGIIITNVVQCANRSPDQVVLATAAPMEIAGTAIAPIVAQANDFTVPPAYQGKTIFKLAPKNDDKVVALTFDDGPWPKTTAEVLEILKQNNIKATFFFVGQPLQKYPQIAQQVVAEGHAIANHTWHHWYHRMNQSTAAKEIEDTNALIYKITGIKTHYFRPPGGALKNGLVDYASQQNYATVMWSVDSGDSRRSRPNASTLVKNVIKGTRPGGIVLMHDGGGNRSATVEALPQIIDNLKQQGYKFVTLPELLEIPGTNSKAEAEFTEPDSTNMNAPFISPAPTNINSATAEMTDRDRAAEN